MSGRRLLDAALVSNAAKNVAKQFFNLKSGQLEAYGKTSSLGRTLRQEKDRVIQSTKAAAALASRLTDQPRTTYGTTNTPFAAQKTESSASHPEPIRRGPTDQANPEDPIQVLVTQRPDSEAPASTGGQDHFSIRFRDPDVPSASSNAEEIPNAAHTVNDQSTQSAQKGLNPDVFYSYSGSRQPVDHADTVATSGQQGTGLSADESLVNAATSPELDTSSLGSPQELASSHVVGQKDVSASGVNIAGTTQETMDPAAKVESSGTMVEERSESPMRESRVPSSRFGRLLEYGGLATSMAFGAVNETFRRAAGNGTGSGSLMLSPANMERLVAKLSHMRGAALKLGQMMSFQDSKMLPAPIHEVLLRVQDHANYMPASQRNKVLVDDLGSDWESLFQSFDEIPMAAASIGQVHRAVMASDGTEVAVKIQYPGVANSISSDLSNLSVLLTASRLLPKGLFLDKTIANARTELAWECDYVREAQCQKRFKDLLQDETDTFTVPAVIDAACGKHVLTAELMHGTAVTKKSLHLTQEQRDWIGTNILRLCLRELVEFKYMQTDPNWTNFLFNPATHKIELLDFGATRDFPDEFVDPYVGILVAASKGDKITIQDLSVQLGYLTGHESCAMTEAHVASILTLAEPFSESLSSHEPYDFRDQTITDRVRGLIPVMLRERLAPPPEETYSLHRKLSGAFLLLARLGSRVKCRQLFEEAIVAWKSKS